MMAKLTASMVVDLEDRTGRKVQSIIGNLDRLKRAERDRMLAQNGVLSPRRDRALERLMMEREEDSARIRSNIAAWAARGATAVAVAGVAAGVATTKAVRDYAQFERTINRIVLNADKGTEAIQPTLESLNRVGRDAQIGLEGAVTGLETLIASGRSLEDGMAFLPSVALTAKASGAAIEDIALSADALSGSMKIGAQDMQRAFDILVAGGKAGKFELKDMSQYLPSLLPAFSALGYEGTEGLQKIVAMLQVMRNQAGTSGEAATYLSNVLNKMYSADTAKKFKGFGIDLPKALDKAKKEGKDLFEVFLDLAHIATKGDLSKLPLLFTDAEMQKGVRALMTQRDLYQEVLRGLGRVDGTAVRDFRQVVGDTQGSIERLEGAWDRLWTKIGQRVSKKAVPKLEALSDAMDEMDARERGTEKTVGDDRVAEREQIAQFKKRFAEYRDKNKRPVIGDDLAAYQNALVDVAEGRADSVMDYFKPLDLARERAKYYRHGYVPGTMPSLEAETKYPNAVNKADTHEGKRGEEFPLLTDSVPVPKYRTEADQAERDRKALRKWAGRYSEGDGREFVTDENISKARKWSMDQNRERMQRETEGLRSGDWRRFFFGAAADEDFDFRDHTQKTFGVHDGGFRPRQRGILGDLEKSAPVDLSNGGSREVTISGTPAVTLSGTPTVITQPSGVQQVTVTNLARPNVTINLSAIIQQAADPQAIAKEIGQAVASEAGRAHQGGGADHGY
ncbi:phage tail tape measure protein [Shinella sp.]|uniref:phage tail tape measure protein n=1 Tax=Shinella sp. TaxID=1870904 RepID=UPI003F6F036F